MCSCAYTYDPLINLSCDCHVTCRFFGEEPPPPPSKITWKVDKKEVQCKAFIPPHLHSAMHFFFLIFLQLAIQLLDLAALFVENDAASPFQLCGIVIPKLVCIKVEALRL